MRCRLDCHQCCAEFFCQHSHDVVGWASERDNWSAHRRLCLLVTEHIAVYVTCCLRNPLRAPKLRMPTKRGVAFGSFHIRCWHATFVALSQQAGIACLAAYLQFATLTESSFSWGNRSVVAFVKLFAQHCRATSDLPPCLSCGRSARRMQRLPRHRPDVDVDSSWAMDRVIARRSHLAHALGRYPIAAR